MYYYAYLDEKDFVIDIYDMPAPISGSQWVSIPSHDETLIGKFYNRTTGEFEDVSVFYYALLDNRDIVTGFTKMDKEVVADSMVKITAEQFNTQSIKGLWYNRETKTFEEPPVHILAELSTSQIQYKSENKWLDQKLDEIEAAIAAGGGSGTAGNDGATFTPNVTADGVLSWTNNKNLPNPTPVNVKGPKGDDGVTPHIGANGNWFVGDTDTGVPAKGSGEAVGGVVFTPSVDAYGTITWTNNGGLQNPTPMNIKGVKGDKGETGAQGEKGDKGDPGEQGLKGETGDRGPQGLQGLKGDKGDPGTPGAVGKQGLKGDKGDKGDTGERGPQGPKGDTGSMGPQGPQGERGYNGSDGQDFNGNLSGGILRLSGTQAAFNSGSMIVLASDSMPSKLCGSACYASKAIQVSSDVRMKENIADIDKEALINFAKKIKLHKFQYIGSKKTYLGVIAQELMGIDPEIASLFVSVDEEGFYTVDYSALGLLSILTLQ